MKVTKNMSRRILAIILTIASIFTSACTQSGTKGDADTTAASTVSPGDLVINEVVTSNSMCLVDEVAGSPDWVELYNTTDHAINLAGLGFSDNNRKLYKYTFTEAVIPAGGYYLFYCAELKDADIGSTQCCGFGISKGGDTLFLTDGYYNIIQQLDVPALTTDVSYARDEQGSYGFCGAPTPGVSNDSAGFTQDQESLHTSVVSDALAITEVMPGEEPWMEIKNISSETLELSNYYVSDKGTNLTRFQLPGGELKAGEYVVVYLVDAKEENPDRIEADFRLSSKDDHVYVADREENLVCEFSWTLGVPQGISIVAGPDGTAAYTAYPTPGGDNSTRTFASPVVTEMDETDPIRISEVLRKNGYSITDASGDREPWVELHNTSGEAVSLKGYYLSDSSNNEFKWQMPDVTLAPDAYLVIMLDGDVEASTQTELHAPFSLSAGESISLFQLDGLRRDVLEIPEDIPKNVSVGRDEEGNIRFFTKPTPGYQNAHGFETAENLGCFNHNSVFVSEVSTAHAIRANENDWIELYNGTDEAVDLGGWYLSNSNSEPLKYQIPEGKTIAPGAYLVVETSSHVSRQKEGVATFGLSPQGETICLSDPDGIRVDTFRTGALSSELTSGRLEDSEDGERVFFTKSTKGKSNNGGYYSGYASAPVFSKTDLYQQNAFQLEMSTATPGAVIRYTTNGAKPTASSKVYSDPVSISRNTVVRAAAFVEGMLPSEITTYTFLFEKEHTLPVVCVCGDPEDVSTVFKAKNRKTKVEREAYISWYERDGKLGTEFPCGIKAKGAGTIIFPQKSLAIHLRGGYGQSSVTYPFFGYGDVKTFSSLVLRNSGQDIGDHTADARVRDSFASRAAVGMHLDYALTTPVIAYINGSYYGIYDFNEDLNKDYLGAHYGVDTEAVDVIRRNSTALKGSNKDIKRVFDFAVNRNLANDATFEEFCQWIDVEYFTDYFIAQTYFSNSDMFNQKYWRSQDYQVKWRPIYYDLDFAGVNKPGRNILDAYFKESGVPSVDGSLTYMNIYIGLKKNKGWRQYAAERYVQVVMQYYNPERLNGILDELVNAMEPEMRRHISKWGKPRSMTDWKNAVGTLHTFINKRPELALNQMQKFFGISGTQMAEWKQKYSVTP